MSTSTSAPDAQFEAVLVPGDAGAQPTPAVRVVYTFVDGTRLSLLVHVAEVADAIPASDSFLQ